MKDMDAIAIETPTEMPLLQKSFQSSKGLK